VIIRTACFKSGDVGVEVCGNGIHDAQLVGPREVHCADLTQGADLCFAMQQTGNVDWIRRRAWLARQGAPPNDLACRFDKTKRDGSRKSDVSWQPARYVQHLKCDRCNPRRTSE